jgi:hypothetical protein
MEWLSLIEYALGVVVVTPFRYFLCERIRCGVILCAFRTVDFQRRRFDAALPHEPQQSPCC